MKRYKTIVADPPWKYGKWGKNSGNGSRGDFSGRGDVTTDLPYNTMSVDEISNLKVADVADENCELYLWVTQKYLPVAFSVMEKWGFKYCQTLTWCKKPRGTGQGGLYCPTTEFLILGRKGKMPKHKKRLDTTWWEVKRPHNQHSKKPDVFQDIIEGQSDEPRLELFARRKKDGWDSWGNEVDSDIQL